MNNSIIYAEKLVESFKCDVYPITLVKFMLNKRRLLNYVSRVCSKDFIIRGPKITLDHSDCEQCNEKLKESEVLCRQHTSVERILNADNVLFDHDTNLYFYKNEIFRMLGNKLVVFYCPHPKLLTGAITDAKVRKVNTLVVDDPKVQETILNTMNFNNKIEFTSSPFFDQNVKTWFNNDFSIVTLPDSRNFSNFYLIPNR